MCGIWGVISGKKNGLYQPDYSFLQTCLIAGAVRGVDGTGVYTVPFDKLKDTADYLKISGDPFNLVNAKEWSPFWSRTKTKGKAVVGHNRAATKGLSTTENAHPFQTEHITMVHNGTIQWGLHKYDKDVDVDSHALTIGLEKEGTSIFGSVTGAFACVWHDSRDATINIAKNDERPLSLFKVGERFVFASELDMLLWAIRRSGLQEKDDAILQVPLESMKHYKFSLENLGDPEVSPIEKKPYVAPVQKYQEKDYYGGYHTKGQSSSDISFKIKKKISLDISDKNGVKSKVPYYLYLGVSDRSELCYFMSVKEYDMDMDYSGMILGTDIGLYAEHMGTEKSVWYNVGTHSVREDIGGNFKDKEGSYFPKRAKKQILKDGCFVCGLPIKHTELNNVIIHQCSDDEWIAQCPSCEELPQ